MIASFSTLSLVSLLGQLYTRWPVPARQCSKSTVREFRSLFTSAEFPSILIPHADTTTSSSHHWREQRLRAADRGNAGAQEISSLCHDAQREGPQHCSGALGKLRDFARRCRVAALHVA